MRDRQEGRLELRARNQDETSARSGYAADTAGRVTSGNGYSDVDRAAGDTLGAGYPARDRAYGYGTDRDHADEGMADSSSYGRQGYGSEGYGREGGALARENGTADRGYGTANGMNGMAMNGTMMDESMDRMTDARLDFQRMAGEDHWRNMGSTSRGADHMMDISQQMADMTEAMQTAMQDMQSLRENPRQSGLNRADLQRMEQQIQSLADQLLAMRQTVSSMAGEKASVH